MGTWLAERSRKELVLLKLVSPRVVGDQWAVAMLRCSRHVGHWSWGQHAPEQLETWYWASSPGTAYVEKPQTWNKADCMLEVCNVAGVAFRSADDRPKCDSLVRVDEGWG